MLRSGAHAGFAITQACRPLLEGEARSGVSDKIKSPSPRSAGERAGVRGRQRYFFESFSVMASSFWRREL
jgi:hypothetical protein